MDTTSKACEPTGSLLQAYIQIHNVLEAENEKLRNEVKEAERNLVKKIEEIIDLGDEQEKQGFKLVEALEQNKNYQEQLERLSNEKQDLTRELQTERKEKEALALCKFKMEQESIGLNDRVRKQEVQLEECEVKAGTLEEEVNANNQELRFLRSENQKLEMELQNHFQEKAKSSLHQLEMEREIIDLKSKVQMQQQALNKGQMEIGRLKQEVGVKSKDLIDVRLKLDQCRRDMKTKNQCNLACITKHQTDMEFMNKQKVMQEQEIEELKRQLQTLQGNLGKCSIANEVKTMQLQITNEKNWKRDKRRLWLQQEECTLEKILKTDESDRKCMGYPSTSSQIAKAVNSETLSGSVLEITAIPVGQPVLTQNSGKRSYSDDEIQIISNPGTLANTGISNKVGPIAAASGADLVTSIIRQYLQSPVCENTVTPP